MRSISIEPLINCPFKAQIGKTYSLTVDLKVYGDWPYNEEEQVLHCLIKTMPFFSYEVIGDGLITLNKNGRVGYSYPHFALTAMDKIGKATIEILFVNSWGIPVMNTEEEIEIVKERLDKDNLNFIIRTKI